MNFLEAVKAMKEGNKIRRPLWVKGHYWFVEEGYIKDQSGDCMNSSYASWFLAEDWEIFYEDKDWNLADNSSSFNGRTAVYEKPDVEKCRDLIIIDLNTCSEENSLPLWRAARIINKRFGDLR